MERLALEDEVSALSVYAAATPLLEQEILVQGDRAAALQRVTMTTGGQLAAGVLCPTCPWERGRDPWRVSDWSGLIT